MIVAFAVVGLGWLAFSLATGVAQDDKKIAIKEVMKTAMASKLCQKVAKGDASEEEKKKLAGLFAALHENKPPKGDESAWKDKTKALVDAANDVLAGKAGAGERLAAAANCMACHSAHKGK